MSAPRDTIRLDKWLWYARFFKTRSLASQAVAGGRVRVNSVRVTKPAQMVGPRDILTFAQGARVRVVRIVAPGLRRGPAAEAQALYEDLSDPVPSDPGEPQPRSGGRPRGRERRRYDTVRRTALD